MREKHGYHQQCKRCPSVIPNQSNKIKNKNDYDRHKLKEEK